MDRIFKDIKTLIYSETQFYNKNCNSKKKKRFEEDIECINEELDYKEIGSSNFSFDMVYKSETNFFKNIYIDEFKHKDKKSVDILTLSNFNSESKGRFYFIEVKKNLNCYRWDEIKEKLIDSIERLNIEFSHDNLNSYIFIVGIECGESEENSANTLKIKKSIEDIEFLDMPLGKVNIIEPNCILGEEIK